MTRIARAHPERFVSAQVAWPDRALRETENGSKNTYEEALSGRRGSDFPEADPIPPHFTGSRHCQPDENIFFPSFSHDNDVILRDDPIIVRDGGRLRRLTKQKMMSRKRHRDSLFFLSISLPTAGRWRPKTPSSVMLAERHTTTARRDAKAEIKKKKKKTGKDRRIEKTKQKQKTKQNNTAEGVVR